MLYETRKYRLIGQTEILGSRTDNAVYSEFVASKSGIDNGTLEEEEDFISVDEKGLTVFPQDEETNEIFLFDYQIKGFLKEAFECLKGELNIAAARSKVDKYVFITPRKVFFKRDGEPILDADDRCERPLRAKTMQGERVALQASEQIDTPWELEIEIKLLPNNGTAKSKPIDWDAIETALDYGAFRGLGQWRNASYGQFKWERAE